MLNITNICKCRVVLEHMLNTLNCNVYLLELRPSAKNIDLEHFEHWIFRAERSRSQLLILNFRSERSRAKKWSSISSDHRAISSISLKKIFEQNRAFFEQNQAFFEHDKAEPTANTNFWQILQLIWKFLYQFLIHIWKAQIFLIFTTQKRKNFLFCLSKF